MKNGLGKWTVSRTSPGAVNSNNSNTGVWINVIVGLRLRLKVKAKIILFFLFEGVHFDDLLLSVLLLRAISSFVMLFDFLFFR